MPVEIYPVNLENAALKQAKTNKNEMLVACQVKRNLLSVLSTLVGVFSSCTVKLYFHQAQINTVHYGTINPDAAGTRLPKIWIIWIGYSYHLQIFTVETQIIAYSIKVNYEYRWKCSFVDFCADLPHQLASGLVQTRMAPLWFESCVRLWNVYPAWGDHTRDCCAAAAAAGLSLLECINSLHLLVACICIFKSLFTQIKYQTEHR